MRAGFTLIELSIVLVIIGLIVGGILVGRDMIEAAQIRATIAQYQQFVTAVNTFRLKYGGLPGDITSTQAAAFGFQPARMDFVNQPCGSGSAITHGDGFLEACDRNFDAFSFSQIEYEYGLFWRDLSSVQLIGNQFTIAVDGYNGAGHQPNELLPVAKLGDNNYWIAYGVQVPGAAAYGGNGYPVGNYFQLTGVTGLSGDTAEMSNGLSPLHAFALDNKIDDGAPFGGIVRVSPSAGNIIFPSYPNSSCAPSSTDKAYRLAQTPNMPTCTLSFRSGF